MYVEHYSDGEEPWEPEWWMGWPFGLITRLAGQCMKSSARPKTSGTSDRRTS